jgi:type IV pilus assembly protein PilV
MRTLLAPRSSRRMGGMSLIEIMVAVLLISFSLLGLMSLQARALQFSVDSEDSTRAALLASELAATMWANNSVTVPAAQLLDWQARVANAAAAGLPNGVGTVTVVGNTATINVQWRPPRSALLTNNRYETDVVIPIII